MADIFDQAATAPPSSPTPAAPASSAPPIGDVFDQAASAPPQDAGSTQIDLSKATGIGPGPGWFARKWDEVKQGVSSAQEGEGLKKQPTVLGNAAQLGTMAGTVAMDLGIGPGMAEGASAISDAIPSAGRAGQAFQELKGAIGNHTVAVTDKLADTLSEIKDAVDTGSSLPSVINKFVTRIADVDEGPLTYKEARQFYSNVSDLSASEKMAAKGKDLRLVNLFKYALGESISNTAQAAGRLEQYQGAMSEYAKSMRIADAMDKVKDIATKAAVTAGAGGAGYAGYKAVKDVLDKLGL